MVSAINLDRYRLSTQQYLQSVTSRWAPLYSISGSHNLNVNPGINGTSSFTINTQNALPNLQANQFSGQANSLLGDTQYLKFNPNNPGAVEVSSLDNANTNVRPFGFDPSNGALPALLIGGGSTPATAPEIPDAFAERTQYFELNESNFAAMVASGEFDLPTIGLGLRYTTDGTNITGVSVRPSARTLQARNLGELNSINSAGIIYPGDTGTNPVPATPTQPGDLGPLIGQGGKQPVGQPLQNPAINPNQNPFRALTPNGVNPTAQLNAQGNLATNNNDLNNIPAFAQIAFAPQQGVTVFGQHAEADAQTTRHIASVQAKLDVNVSQETQQQVGRLQELATQQLAIAAKGMPLPAERNGIIPLVTPHIYQPQPGSDIISTADQQSTMNLSTEMNDRQSSGASLMLGLMLGGGSNAGTGPGADTGSFNPFSGSSNGGGQQGAEQQDPRKKPYKPLYFSA